MPAKIVNPMMGIDVSFDREASIGREKGNTIVIPRIEVSSAHAKILWDEAARGYVLEDLGSSNGTWLDGHRVKQPEKLGKRSVITLANEIELMFHDLGTTISAAPPEPRPPAPPRAEPPKQVDMSPSTSPENAFLPIPGPLGQIGQKPATPVLSSTNLDNEVLPLPGKLGQKPATPVLSSTNLDNEVVPLPGRLGQKPASPVSTGPPAGLTTGADRTSPYVGDPLPLPPVVPETRPTTDPNATQDRSPLPALALEVYTVPMTRRALSPGDNVVGKGEKATILVGWVDVSRVHASIVVEPTRIVLTDLGSTYGTFHEGRRVEGAVEIRPGDTIQFGSVKARVVPALPPGR